MDAAPSFRVVCETGSCGDLFSRDLRHLKSFVALQGLVTLASSARPSANLAQSYADRERIEVFRDVEVGEEDLKRPVVSGKYNQ